ncbi:DcaP family trimeric outer membrane transporter [Billgrantia lactosivorans]|uniref:DcaP family trimeric outer membrane transporter n=1 Tax=Billgrantia lactosivorans TaxID=2185141 RepID=UPI000DAB8B82|nr:DcaP family trimeric outer membrane transporter [Halomonas lactosivorans]
MTFHKNLKKTAIFSASALALAVASAANAFEFEAGDTTVSVYGYAKLDVIYDVDNEIGEKSVARGDIALDGEETSDGHTNLHAAESRIGFSTSTPVSGSTLKTTIEGDFYGGTANAPEFRLRHAFGEWNGILAGQTWTNFGSFLAGTPTIDFTGIGGRAVLDRQAQLRYTTGGFSMAIEDPDKLGGSPVNDDAKNQLPDLTARYQGNAGNFSYSVSGLLRRLEYDTVGGSDDTATGWGMGFDASLAVSDALTLRGGIAHGDGIGGYLHGNPAAPAIVDADGNLETIEATGGTVGASLNVGPGAINLAYTLIDPDLDESNATADDNAQFEDVWLNYIWSPGNRISYGIEASWHSREVVDGRDGDAMRLQGMVKYDF